MAGLASEAQAWADRTVKATEPHPGQAPEIDTGAHDLWLFIIGTEANRALKAGDLVKAEQVYRQIAASAEGGNSEKENFYLANACHHLGMVAEFRGRLDEAEGWHKKTLTFTEVLGDRPGLAAATYQQHQ